MAVKESGHGRAFALGVALNFDFVAVEVYCGILADSLALIADAGHNFGDVLGLSLAWGAASLARRGPTPRFTYGLRSTTILAALANATLLLLVTGGIAWEAVLRFRSPQAVDERVMIGVALLGALINTGTALLFMKDRKSDLNIRGAFLHMAADAAVSVGVVLSGIGIALTGWLWLDAAASLAIAAVILLGTVGLLRDSFRLALHAVPDGVDSSEVRSYLCGLPGVAEAHDLHIWAMSTTETALTVHLVMPGGFPGDDFIASTARDVEHRFGIGHTTLQVETGAAQKPCSLASDHVV